MNRKGFTLIELMVVILIVAILAAVAIPIMRGRLNAARWSEGKAMMGTIASACRAYGAERGVLGTQPSIVGTGATSLGFTAADLTGTYFTDTMFSITAYTVPTATNNCTFTISCTNANLDPTNYTLTSAGVWAP